MPQKFEKKQNSISIKMDLALFNIGGGQVDLGLFKIKGVKYKSSISFLADSCEKKFRVGTF